MTTRRYTESDIQRFVEKPDWLVTQVSVDDRFGSNGIVGVMLVRHEKQRFLIDTLLLSCRVIGRTVETAMLAWLVDRARTLHVSELWGEFIPTAKNAPAASVYADHGFQLVEDVDGRQKWRLDVQCTSLQIPEWFKVEHGATIEE